jgi:Fe-S-cluster containining protein
MKKLNFNFSDILETVSDKPADMLEYAKEQMGRVKQLLNEMPDYTCPPSCKECCHGSILMSYVEYINALQGLRERYGPDRLAEIFTERLGVLEDEGKLLCPFVNDAKEEEHCGIYQERPLICRVFGTTASPCEEDIAHPHFPEGPFYRAYNLLYYVDDGSFIGLPLTEGLALYEAPFDIWAIADSGQVEELMELFAQHGSMRAVICDLAEDTYFTILPDGKRKYLE